MLHASIRWLHCLIDNAALLIEKSFNLSFSPAIIGVLLALVQLLGGCANKEVNPRPVIDYPERWQESGHTQNARPVNQAWWREFKVGQLDALVDAALEKNGDIQISAERLYVAGLELKNSESSLFPSVNVAARSDSRTNLRDGGSGKGSSLSATLAYDISLWGEDLLRFRSADSSYRATSFDHENARLTLVAAVVKTFFSIQAIQTKIEFEQRNLALSERILRIIESRYRNGAVSLLDFVRQENVVLLARQAIVPLQQQERQQRRALDVLLGQRIGTVEVPSLSLKDINVPTIELSQPVQALRNRPDLAAAESRLDINDHDVAQARASLYPVKLSLAIDTSMESNRLGLLNLMPGTSQASVALSFARAIFDRGQLQNKVKITESGRRQAFIAWQQAVLNSITEVENAMASLSLAKAQEVDHVQILRESRKALQLAELRYRAGVDGLSVLLDTQRSLYESESREIQLRVDSLNAAADLYKAIGGGWFAPDLTNQDKEVDFFDRIALRLRLTHLYDEEPRKIQPGVGVPNAAVEPYKASGGGWADRLDLKLTHLIREK